MLYFSPNESSVSVTRLKVFNRTWHSACSSNTHLNAVGLLLCLATLSVYFLSLCLCTTTEMCAWWCAQVWSPDLILYVSAAKPLGGLLDTEIAVYPDGSTMWSRPGVLVSPMPIVRTYPTSLLQDANKCNTPPTSSYVQWGAVATVSLSNFRRWSSNACDRCWEISHLINSGPLLSSDHGHMTLDPSTWQKSNRLICSTLWLAPNGIYGTVVRHYCKPQLYTALYVMMHSTPEYKLVACCCHWYSGLIRKIWKSESILKIEKYAVAKCWSIH